MDRIALVTLEYAPSRGGVARYLSNLVAASGGEIDVFVPETHATQGPGHVEEARLLDRPPFAWMPATYFIHRLKSRGYSTVLVSHALPMGSAAYLASCFGGPKYAVLFHGLDLRLAQTHRRKAWMLRKILRGASLVIANSEFVAGEIRAFDSAVQPLVITPGVEQFDLPDRAASREALHIASNESLILSVARLIPRKGIDTLIRCLADLPPDTRLTVIGDGPDRHRLEHLAEPVKDRVRFVTDASDEIRNQWYAAADLFALPARDEGRDVEGFGIACLEAAAAGLPIVAGKSGGMSETIVDRQTGLLVDPLAVPSVCRALKRLVVDGIARTKFGRAGKRRVEEEFRWEDRWKRLAAHITKKPRVRKHDLPSGTDMSPLISIIIPVWNHADDVFECLRSLENQTRKHFEVIVVDDGSEDGLAEKIKQFHPSFPFQFIRFETNCGAPAARNAGFRLSHGEFLWFLDADTVMESEMLEKMERALEEHPEAAFAYCSFYYGWKKFMGQPFDPIALRRKNYIHTSSLLRRRDFPGFDESLKKFQDWDLWLTIAARGGIGVWIPEELFTIKPHGPRRGMSKWLPEFFYHLPWAGTFSPTVKRYRKAEAIIRKKHGI